VQKQSTIILTAGGPKEPFIFEQEYATQDISIILFGIVVLNKNVIFIAFLRVYLRAMPFFIKRLLRDWE
jgi:hypothetical protein